MHVVTAGTVVVAGGAVVVVVGGAVVVVVRGAVVVGRDGGEVVRDALEQAASMQAEAPVRVTTRS